MTERDHKETLLAPIYERFTEGFETMGLKQANALLEELNWGFVAQVTYDCSGSENETAHAVV